MALIEKLPKTKKNSSLAVPFSITIFKKCVKYRISDTLVHHLHFFDLQCLIMQFEIQDIQEYLERKNREQMQKQGIKEIKDISGADAVKFLGR